MNLCAVRSWWDNSAATIVAYPHPFSGHSRRVCILITWVARSDLDLHLEPHCSQTTLLFFFAAHFFFAFSFDKDAEIEIKLDIYILVKLNWTISPFGLLSTPCVLFLWCCMCAGTGDE